jgi:hypothetical protein
MDWQSALQRIANFAYFILFLLTYAYTLAQALLDEANIPLSFHLYNIGPYQFSLMRSELRSIILRGIGIADALVLYNVIVGV